MNLKEFKKRMSPEQVERVLLKLGVAKEFETDKAFLYKTVCHNQIGEEASHKLYYYFDSKLFKCYTQCNNSFDIFELMQKIYEINREPISLREAIRMVAELVGENFSNIEVSNYIEEQLEFEKFMPKEDKIILEYNPMVLQVFAKYYPQSWLNEGITKESMDKFQIGYHYTTEQITIPYFNGDGKLVGVRGRNSDTKKAKYMPVKVGNQYLKHNTRQVLYGEFHNKEEIRKTSSAILFEGEKSVMKLDGFQSIPNIALAVGGNSILPEHVSKLLKLGVSYLFIAFDKEFEEEDTLAKNNYYKLQKNLAQYLSQYFYVYFLFDENNLLDIKDAPVDKGELVFLDLLHNKKTAE